MESVPQACRQEARNSTQNKVNTSHCGKMKVAIADAVTHSVLEKKRSKEAA